MTILEDSLGFTCDGENLLRDGQNGYNGNCEDSTVVNLSLFCQVVRIICMGLSVRLENSIFLYALTFNKPCYFSVNIKSISLIQSLESSARGVDSNETKSGVSHR
jgi:hypothetical protein